VATKRDAFLGGLDARQRGRFAVWAGLDDAIADVWTAVRAVRPSLPDASDDFLRYLATHVSTELDPESALASLRVDELYLAWACLRGDPSATAQLRAAHAAHIDRALVRFARQPGDFVAEVRQLVWTKLLTGDAASSPKLALYAGRGKLESWLRVLTVRTALSHLRGIPGLAEEEQIAVRAAGDADPELRLMRSVYRAQFRDALQRAMATLGREERGILRYHFLDGLSIDKLAPLLRVSRATAARQLSRAKERLIALARGELARAVGMPASEIDTILRLLQSQMDVSGALFFDPDSE
jgi:RNA polymerase sigma-70 factor (ECF subfamily)